MCSIWLFIIIILIVIIITAVVVYNYTKKPIVIDINYTNIENKIKNGECFERPAITINGTVLYAIYKADENDYKFVERWSNDIPFYIVNNGEPSEWAVKMQTLPNVKFIARENKGLDVEAWKAGMKAWNDELSTYDIVGFINNSSVYAVDLKKLMANAMDYDAYGLTPYYFLPFIFHLQSPFILYHKRLYNSEFFKKHWENVTCNSYIGAVIKNEVGMGMKLTKAGYKLGVYDLTHGGSIQYCEDKKTDIYKREFLKKKVNGIITKRREHPEETIMEYSVENADAGYILN